MHAKSAAEKDSAAGMTSAPRPAAPWRVAAVEVRPNYQLRVEFQDGTAGIVDMSRLLRAGEGAGVFGALADPEAFGRVRIEHGAVTWPGEIDLAPDAMYDAIRDRGTWVVS